MQQRSRHAAVFATCSSVHAVQQIVAVVKFTVPACFLVLASEEFLLNTSTVESRWVASGNIVANGFVVS